MLAFATSLLAIVAFALVFVKLHIVAVAKTVIDRARSGTLAMFDSTLTDEQKEAAVQAAVFGQEARQTLRLVQAAQAQVYWRPPRRCIYWVLWAWCRPMP